MAIQRDKVIANAEKLVAKGKIEPAIKEYERLLEESPNDVNTLNRIGDLWVRINRTDEAVKTFGKIADHYAKDGFFLKAIAIYKKINKLDPSKLEVYSKLADLYAKQGLAMEAKSQYQVLADYYIKHGEPGNALVIYKKIAELDPNAINIHVKLADLNSQAGQTAEALKEYDRVGRMLLKRGMLDEAVQVFRKALKIDPKNIELVESLIAALVEAKDFDNAQQIIESSLEANKNNPRLVAMWSRVLIGKGDINSARAALEQAMAADPNVPATREALAELYLKQNNIDKAAQLLGPLAEATAARGDRAGAVELLNRILRVEPTHTPTMERMVSVYTRLNEETNILAAMNSLAEAHIAKGKYDQAAGVLERLIQREPQNSQHRTKLQFVRSQMGGVDTLPRGKTAEAPPVMEVEEPMPDIDSLEEPVDTPATEMDFSEFGSAATPPPPMEIAEEVPIEVEGESDDLDFITEHLTEAEVFAKYGLAEKAVEHLRTILERAPKHLPAHDKLVRILLDEGDIDAARAAATQYVALLQEKGDTDGIDAIKNEFLSRGQSLATPAAAAPRRAPTVERPAPAKAAPAAEEELSLDLDNTGPEITIEPEEAPVAEEAISIEEELPALEVPTAEEPVEELPVAELPAADEPVESFEESVAEPELTLGAPEEQEISFTEEPASGEEPFFGVEAVAEPEPEPEPVVETLSAEDLSELDGFIAQEMLPQAREKLQDLQALFPENPELAKRKRRLDTAVAAAEAIASAQAAAKKPAAPAIKPPAAAKAPPKATPPPRPAPPPLVIDNDLLAAIPDDDELPVATAPPPPPPAAAAPQPPPPSPLAAAQEENLFAEEDSFFDLAAELESELVDDAGEQVSISEEEQSLEQIFKEFKKGVEQQLDSEDYDTHYNLGIAYKEMGLIDEAIGEFQLASKDAKRAVECASMLGLCFLEKGMPQLAIKWYRKGLEMPEIREEEHLGLLYDLGSAYVEVGDPENAQKAFMEVYGMNTNYRDVVSRIKQLEDA